MSAVIRGSLHHSCAHSGDSLWLLVDMCTSMWMSKERVVERTVLLADTETGKDFSQQFVTANATGYFS